MSGKMKVIIGCGGLVAIGVQMIIVYYKSTDPNYEAEADIT